MVSEPSTSSRGSRVWIPTRSEWWGARSRAPARSRSTGSRLPSTLRGRLALLKIEPGVVKYEPHAKLTELTFDQPKQEWVPGYREPFGALEIGGYFRETGPPTLSGLSLALYVPMVASLYRPSCTITIHESGVAAYDLTFVDLYEWFYPDSKGAARLKELMMGPGIRTSSRGGGKTQAHHRSGSGSRRAGTCVVSRDRTGRARPHRSPLISFSPIQVGAATTHTQSS